MNASPTPFHAVQNARLLLMKAGFTELSERENWTKSVEPGKSYYTTRNGSSIIAFGIGGKWKPGNGIGIVGAHTDSPCLKVKPVSKKFTEGYMAVGVETYGGGIWHTWFDRDLSLAGRVVVMAGSSSSKGEQQNKRFESKLVKIDKPILRIPTLAIHLDPSANEKLEFNKETNFQPIVARAAEALNDKGVESTSSLSSSAEQRHHPEVLELIRKELKLESISDIRDFELCLYDTQKSCLGGLNDEFLFSPRLDNLNMSFCAIKGIIESQDLPEDESIRMISLFDHEEIGSLTAQGADSNFIITVITRLSHLGDRGANSPSAFEETLAKSVLLSADMAHAVNPNYANKYEASHKPVINGGPVIKINANARYATNSPGVVVVEECARLANIPIQRFVVRNDSRCGSTIGKRASSFCHMY